jgi:hypothetical protein
VQLPHWCTGLCGCVEAHWVLRSSLALVGRWRAACVCRMCLSCGDTMGSPPMACPTVGMR